METLRAAGLIVCAGMLLLGAYILYDELDRSQVRTAEIGMAAFIAVIGIVTAIVLKDGAGPFLTALAYLGNGGLIMLALALGDFPESLALTFPVVVNITALALCPKPEPPEPPVRQCDQCGHLFQRGDDFDRYRGKNYCREHSPRPQKYPDPMGP